MTSRTPLTRLLLALTCFAVAVAQAVGGVSAYLCVCGGEATVVLETHCHGPHGAQCHDEIPADMHQHDGTEGDSEEHEAITSELTAASATGSTVVVSAPALVAIFAAVDWAPMFRPAQFSVRAVEARGSPPPIAVARTVVFLI